MRLPSALNFGPERGLLATCQFVCAERSAIHNAALVTNATRLPSLLMAMFVIPAVVLVKTIAFVEESQTYRLVAGTPGMTPANAADLPEAVAALATTPPVVSARLVRFCRSRTKKFSGPEILPGARSVA